MNISLSISGSSKPFSHRQLRIISTKVCYGAKSKMYRHQQLTSDTFYNRNLPWCKRALKNLSCREGKEKTTCQQTQQFQRTLPDFWYHTTFEETSLNSPPVPKAYSNSWKLTSPVLGRHATIYPPPWPLPLIPTRAGWLECTTHLACVHLCWPIRGIGLCTSVLTYKGYCMNIISTRDAA